MEGKPESEEMFVKVSELTIEEGQVTIRNPELAAALEEFAAQDPETRTTLQGKLVVAW